MRKFSLLALIIFSRGFAATWYVDTINDTAFGSGMTGSLRYCIDNAGDGDTVDFDIGGASATVALTGTGSLLAIEINQTSLIIQNSSMTAISISGSGLVPIFYVASGADLNLSGVTLTSGLAIGGNGGVGSANGGVAAGGAGGGGAGLGGAIFIDDGGSATISSVAFTSNVAEGGMGGTADFGTSPGFGGFGGGGGNSGSNGIGSPVGGGGGGGGGWGLGNGGGGGGQLSGSGPGGGSGDSGDGGSGGTNTSAATTPTGGGGGGGASPTATNATAGGFGGGGGGGGSTTNGAMGGFGGGGGGANSGTPASGGYGGGAGAVTQGGGGAAFGGAIFVTNGGSLTFGDNVSFSSNNVYGGSSGGGSAGNGASDGQDLYINSGSTLTLEPTMSATFSSEIAGDTLNSGGGVVLNASSSDVEITLSATNDYGGTTTITQGILSISGDSNLGASTTALLLDGGTLLTTGSFTLGADRDVSTDSSSSGISVNDGTSFTIDQDISGIGAITMSSNGEGILYLGGTNGYSGGTTIDSGILSIATDRGLGSTSGALTLSGGELQVTASVNLAGTRTVTTTDPSSGIDVADMATFTIGQSIGGTGGLTVTSEGNGVLLLTSASGNAFSGGLTIDTGAVSVAQDNQLGDASGILTLNGGTLDITDTFTLSNTRIVSLANEYATSTIDISTGKTLTIEQGIQNGSTVYVGGLNLTGPGELILEGTSTYTGNTTIEAGTLALSGTGSIADSSSLSIDSGATFDITAATQDVYINDLSGSGNLNAEFISGPYNLQVTANDNTSFYGALSGNATLILSGDYTLNFSGSSNSYSGGNILQGNSELEISEDADLGTGAELYLNGGELGVDGTFTLGSSSARTISVGPDYGGFDVRNGYTLTVPQNISGVGGVYVDNYNSGVVVFSSGTGNSFEGGLALDGGILSVSQDNQLGMVGTGTIEGLLYFDGGTLEITTGFTLNNARTVLTDDNNSGIDVAASQTLTIPQAIEGPGGLKVNPLGGTGHLIFQSACTYTGNTEIDNGILYLTGSGSIADSDSVEVDSTLDVSGVVASPNVVYLQTLSGNDNGEIYGAGQALYITQNSDKEFAGVIVGINGLSKEGGNRLYLSGMNTYTGGTVVDDGTLEINSDASLGDTSGSLSIGDAELYVNGTFTLSPSRSVDLYSLNSQISVENEAMFTIAQAITDMGTSIGGLTLTSDGDGILALGNLNTYSGGTSIDSGILQITGDGALGNPDGFLSLNGGILQVTANSFSLSDTRYTTTSSDSGGIDIAAGQTLTISQSIQNGNSTGALTVNPLSGTGTLILESPCTYTDSTTIEAGTLMLVYSGSIADAYQTIVDGTLDVTVVFADSVTIPTLSGSGTIIGMGQTLYVVQGMDEIFSGGISGVSSVVKQGSGTLTFTGMNSYDTGTTIESGILQVSADSALGNPTTGFVALGGGTLEISGTFTLADTRAVSTSSSMSQISVDSGDTFTVNQGITGAGAIISSGEGVLELYGTNAFSGGLEIDSGIVRIEHDRGLGAIGGALTLNGGILQLTGNSVTLDDTRTITLSSNSGIDVDSTETLTIPQGISGGGGLNVNPLGLTTTGTLLLQGDCSYSGSTTVDAGTLALTGTASIFDSISVTLAIGSLLDLSGATADVSLNNLSGGGDVYLPSGHTLSDFQSSNNELDGVISGAGAFTFASDDFTDNTLTLTNTNTYTGATTINAGTLALTGSGSIADSTALSGAGAGTLDITGITSDSTEVGSLSGSITISIAGKTLEVDQIADGSFDGNIGGSGGAFTFGGTHTLTLDSADLSYSGATTVSHSTLILTGVTSLSNSSSTEIAAGATLDVSGVTTSGVTLNNLFGAGSLIATGQALTLDQTTYELYSGSISGSGASLYYTGGSMLILSGDISFTGSTEINSGILALSDSSSLAGSSAMTIDSDGVLDTSGVTLMGGAFVNNLSGSGEIVTGSIFGVVQTSPLEFSGNISGSGKLILQGTSTLTLSGGDNTYSGGTEIQEGATLSIAADVLGDTSGSLSLVGGTLQATNSFSLAIERTVSTSSDSSGINVSNGESLVIDQAIIDGSSNGGITLTSDGSGILTLGGASTYHGPTAVDSGILSLIGDGALTNSSSTSIASGALVYINVTSTETTLNQVTGSGTISMEGQTLTVNQTSEGSFSGTISGSGGALIKSGVGSLGLSGTLSYTGNTQVEEGILALNSSVSGSVSVGASGTLSGVCTIGGDLTVDGIVAPGNSPGSMIIMGNLILNSGSETDIAITPTNASELIVTGSATIDGALVITAAPGIYLGQTQYTILTAEGAVTPSPGFFPISGGAPGSELSVIYNPHSVVLTYLTQLRDLKLTGNALNFINYLNANSANPALEPIITLMALLTPRELEQAAILCTPARNASATFASQNTMFSFSRSISTHLGDQRLLRSMYKKVPSSEESAYLAFFETRQKPVSTVTPAGSVKKMAREEDSFSIWIDGFTEFSHQKAQNQVPAFNVFSGGVLIGFDAYLDDRGEVGVAFGYARNAVHEGEAQGKNSTDLLAATVYGTVYLGDAYIETAVWGTYDEYQTKRAVSFTGFSGDAKASFRGTQVTPHVSIGYDFLFKWGCIEPFAMCDWVFNFENHYKEHGASPLNMSVQGSTSSMLRFECGLNCYQNFENERVMIIFKEMASYVYKHPYSLGKMNAAIVGAEGTFFNDSFTTAQSLFSPSFEIFVKDKKNGRFCSLLYEGEFGSGYSANEALARIGKYF